VDALFAPVADAGPSVRGVRHALIITRCGRGVSGCPALDGDASVPEPTYRVVFGSGTGTIRSRGQAWATLYGELRDRTALGEHLDAEPNEIRDGAADEDVAPTHDSNKGSDALSAAASQIMRVVDSSGEISIDVLPEWGRAECEVSIGPRGPDGRAGRCLVEAPPRAARPARTR
jgi:hypothetical protein